MLAGLGQRLRNGRQRPRLPVRVGEGAGRGLGLRGDLGGLLVLAGLGQRLRHGRQRMRLVVRVGEGAGRGLGLRGDLGGLLVLAGLGQRPGQFRQRLRLVIGVGVGAGHGLGLLMMEREYIRDRTLEGHESARARGKSIGGAAVTDDAMLAVALHLRGQEMSLRDIAPGSSSPPARRKASTRLRRP